MLIYFRTTQAVVFWQWVNQSFNALVNYTNRNANSPITTSQLGVAYVSATVAAMITAIGCKSFWEKRANPLMAVSFTGKAHVNAHARCPKQIVLFQNVILHELQVKRN